VVALAGYDAAIDPQGRLAGGLEFELDALEAMLLTQVPLGRLDVREATVRTAAGARHAEVFGAPGGDVALRVAGAGRYSCRFVCPADAAGTSARRLALVPALSSTVRLAVPSGMRPVVAIYSTFAQRAYDQILHDVCLQNLPVVLVLDRAGLVGDDGPTHHGAFDLSYLRHIPNLTIMAPRDEAELCRMLVTALQLPGPTAIRFPRGTGPGVPVPEVPEPLPVGKAEVLREGDDVLVLAVGTTVGPVLEACEALREEGLRPAVVNARFVKPLDADLICDLAARTGRVVTVEENALAGGFGSSVVELLADRGLGQVSVRRVGLPDRYVPHGDAVLLLEECGLDAASLRETIRALAGAPSGVPTHQAIPHEGGEGSLP